MKTSLKKLTALCFALTFVAVAFYTPYQAAQINTTIVFANGSGAGDYKEVTGQQALKEQKKTAIESTISSSADTATAANTGEKIFLDKVLDPIVWSVSRNLLTQMTQSIVNWINSGFDGSPRFVTDLEGFLLDVADQAAGEFIDEYAGFLCDPFSLNLRVALEVNYSTKEYEPAECTLTDAVGNVEEFLAGNFEEGGWRGWLELTQRPQNTPYGQYLEFTVKRDAYVDMRQDEERTLLDFGNGFFSSTICFPVDGKPAKEDCIISNPGKIIETQLNEALGVGRESLIVAKEFNQIIGAFLNQLSVQAVTGVNGLLGLSGGTGYTDYAYAGSNGSRPFIDAMAREPQGDPTGGVSEIAKGIDVVGQWAGYHRYVVDYVDDLEARNESNANRTDLAPGCYNVSLPSSFVNKRRTSQFEIDEAALNTLPTLRSLQERLETATTTAAASLDDQDPTNDISIAEIQNEVFSEYNDLRSSGDVPTLMEVRRLEISDRHTFEGDIENFEERMDDRVEDCRQQESGSFFEEGAGIEGEG